MPSETETPRPRRSFHPARQCRHCESPEEFVDLRQEGYYRRCVDVRACHRRMMRPKLTLLPGGARY